MDSDIKNSADTVFNELLNTSAHSHRGGVLRVLGSRSATNPLSVREMQSLIDVLTEEIDRCASARFSSYETAYSYVHQTPSDDDFDFILQQCRAVRGAQVEFAAKKSMEIIASNMGTVAPLPTPDILAATSAPGLDRVISRWKQWKARAKLKGREEVREKQKDAKFPVLNAAEFKTDLDALLKAASADRPLSLLFMDVDKFKLINDRLGGGHEGGDRALMELSEALLRVCQSKGSAYRWGGDEFCILLENHSLYEAEGIAERIRREVRALKIDGLADGFSTSIGVASYPESTEKRSELFSFADKAMYQSKNAGGDCVTKSGTPFSEPASDVKRNTRRKKSRSSLRHL